MPQYILTLDDTKRALLVHDPDFDGDWWTRYFPDRGEKWAYAWRPEGLTCNDVAYVSELSGAGGAFFFLFVAPHHTPHAIKEAKRYLRHKHDVTGFGVIQMNLTRDEYHDIETRWGRGK